MTFQTSGQSSGGTSIEQLEESADHLLGAEYEHRPVPEKARLSLFSNVMVWIGFPMIITGAMTGSILVLGMGFINALKAMIIGNIIMFVYVGLLGLIGTRTGKNFALIATGVFGSKGYVFASGLLSTLLLGWYAVQTGITGALISSTYGMNYVAMTVVAGVLYIGITFIGVRGLHYIGLVSVPLFVVLGLWTLFDSAGHAGWDKVFAYAGNKGQATMSMGVGLTIVLTLFVDAGTVTADFNRWAKNSSDSLIATFSAFPFANLVAMLVGGVMTAALAVPDANPFGADNMFGYMNGKQIVWLTVLAFIFVYLNLGSVCSHCLYNSATGWSRILNGHMRVLALVLGAIGIIVAATNIWSYFIEWLTILGILVPPIGAIILVDQYLFKGDLDNHTDWRVTAFIAWAAGSLAGLLIEFNAKNFSTAACSFLTAAIVYLILCMVTSGRRTA